MNKPIAHPHPSTIWSDPLVDKVEPPHFRKRMTRWLCLLSFLSLFAIQIETARSQSIVPERSGTNTMVTPSGNALNITGGQISGDRANLFHSFQKFGLNPDQIANFLSNPGIRNILGRVVGGDPSVINGLLRVSGGNSNLFLMNPAGIVFGPNSRLDITGSFTATTANGIGFGSGWFNASGANNFQDLVGNPHALGFSMATPGAVVNFSDLTVENGQNLTLLGGTVVNTRSLSAPGGEIIVSAVPGTSLVRLSQPGSLLSLEIQLLPSDSNRPQAWNLRILSLPQLLTAGGVGNADKLTVNPDGKIQLLGSGQSSPPIYVKNRANGSDGNSIDDCGITKVTKNNPNPNSGIDRDGMAAGKNGNVSNFSNAPSTVASPQNMAIAPPSTVASPQNTAIAPPSTVASPQNTAIAPPSTVASPQNTAIAPAVGCQLNNCQPRQPLSVVGIPNNLPKTIDFREQTSPARAREILQSIEHATGIKPAIIYANFRPLTDELDLVLITSKGDPLLKPIGVRKEKVLKMVKNFRLATINPHNDDLEPAQQMYKWMVKPLEANLRAQGINNLLFITDEGLRSLPLAAMHDGKQYLVEKYSVGFAPSLSLTDTRYTDIKKFSPIAMGASEFRELNPLPAVPAELSVVMNKPQDNLAYLNQTFTLDNVKSLSSRYRIIHFATHGQFMAGNPNNSYIQLWGDQKLRLPDLRQLQLYEVPGKRPPVELFVISACQTALGDKNAELGFGGLAAQTGAKTVLASLWTVDDAGTLGLMSKFYSNLHKAPIKAEALRQAQIAMIKGETRIGNGQLVTTERSIVIPAKSPDAKVEQKNLQHPYYWSAFTMIGNPW